MKLYFFLGFLGFLGFLALKSYPAVTHSGKPCSPRQFNHDSIVCVCDEDYCDSLDPLAKTPRGTVQIFESSRAGKRLEGRQTEFNNELEGGSNYWNVTVDRSKTFQNIIGFGGAWSDAAALSIGRMSPNLQKSILRAYFSDEGIEYSTARVVISGCDFSTSPCT